MELEINDEKKTGITKIFISLNSHRKCNAVLISKNKYSDEMCNE